MGERQENEAIPTEGTRGFPIAKTVWGKLIVISAVLLVVAGCNVLAASGRENRLKRDAEVISLMENYQVDDADIYDGSWHGNDGSLPGRYTLHIKKDGSVHTCRQVQVESLRNNEPIKCDSGIVVVPDKEGAL